MNNNEQKTVLVLEDELPLRKAIKMKLDGKDFFVKGVDNVKDGLRFMEENTVDFIWLDHYLLGGADGLDFVVMVKTKPEWKNIPIFVISNTASPDKIKAYLGLGVNKFFTKSNCKLDDVINNVVESIKEDNSED